MKKQTVQKIILGFFCLLAYFIFSKSALASTLYLSPGSANIAVGGTTSVQVRLNVGGDVVNGVSAFLSYPQDKLDVAWVSPGSAFAIEAEKSFGGGIIKISRGNINGVSGNVSVATIGFRGKALGKATVAFIGGSAAPRASDSSDSLSLGGSAGGVFNVIQGVPQAPKTKTLPGQPTATDGAQLQITNIKIPVVATNSATITWQTNIEADSGVEYGLEKDKYILTISEGKMVTEHSLKIENPLLVPGTKIHFRVKSIDESGNITTSEDQVIQLPGYKVRIKIIDKKNVPLAGAEVFLYSDPLKLVTDASGEVVFENITPGKHLVIVKSGGVEKSQEINVEGASLVMAPVMIQTEAKTGKIQLNNYVYLAALVIVLILAVVLAWFINKRRKKQPPSNKEINISQPTTNITNTTNDLTLPTLGSG